LFRLKSGGSVVVIGAPSDAILIGQLLQKELRE